MDPSLLAPFLLALVLPAQTGVSTVGLVPWHHWLRPVVLAILGTGAVFSLLRLRMGSWGRAVPATSLLVALFAWPRPVIGSFLWLADLGLPAAVAGGVTALGWILAVGVVGSLCLRCPPEDPWLRRSREFLFAFAALTLLAGTAGVLRVALALDRSPLPLRTQETLRGTLPENPPDIFWIILDAYPRRDILESVFGLDNSEFYRELEQRGFVLTHESSSNYATTAPSLASALNLDHLVLDPQRNPKGNQEFLAPFVSLARENRLSHFLQGQGYRTVGLSSGAYLLDTGDFDEVHPSHWSNLEYLLLGQTLADLPTLDRQFSVRRENLHSVLQELPRLGRGEQPTFVLAHVLAPHPPFVLGPEGEAVDSGFPRFTAVDYGGIFDYQMGPGWYREHFRDQLLGLNRLVLQALDGILANRQRPAVILLHGDHGSASKRTRDANTEDLRERYAILSAFRFPGAPEPSLYPSLSLVNAGRVLLNRVFSAGLPMLPDQTYYTDVAPGFGLQELPPSLLRPDPKPLGDRKAGI